MTMKNASSCTGKLTFFTVIWFAVLIICGFVTSNIFSIQNPIASIGLFIVGFSTPIFVYRLTWIIIGRSDILPRCKNKKCNTKNYRIRKQTDEGVIYVCECGDSYLLTTSRDQFQFIANDGTLQPYRQRINGQWWPAPELFYMGTDSGADQDV